MEFECDFSIHSCHWYNNLYRCEVTNVFKTSRKSGLKYFIGDHTAGKTNDDVKVFKIFKQPLRVFPRNLHKVFPNLTHLVIQRCGLKNITKEDLIGLENLEHLSVWGNILTTLPNDLFVNMKKLRRVFFGNNPIEDLSSKVFEPLEPTLEYVNFENDYINKEFNKNGGSKNTLQQMMRILDNRAPPLCELLVEPVPEVEEEDFKVEQNELMRRKFLEFKASETFTDFTIKVRGKDFKVHKNILAAHSSVFEEIFTSDGAEAARTFPNVKNSGENAFESFLDYFYSGELRDEVSAIEMFELATVFKVPVLETLCTDRILDNLQESNAPEVFNLGHQHQLKALKEPAFKVIQKMFPEIPDDLKDVPDQINKIIKAKRELDVILADVKGMKII